MGTTLAIIVSLCGCAGPSTSAATPPRVPRLTAPSPLTHPDRSPQRQLESRSATLSDLREQARHRPVGLRIPGYPNFDAVQAYTTNPVTHGLNLPNNANTVAWWSSGSMPGDPTGTVVLAAHISYNGRLGPFTHVDRLPPGAIVSVRQANGAVQNFRVAGKRVVNKAALQREDLFRTTGPPRLALITCGGPYNATTRNYRDNVIVYALPTS